MKTKKQNNKDTKKEYKDIIKNKNLRNNQNYIYSKNKVYRVFGFNSSPGVKISSKILNLKKGNIYFVDNNYIIKRNNLIEQNNLILYFILIPLVFFYLFISGIKILYIILIFLVFLVLLYLPYIKIIKKKSNKIKKPNDFFEIINNIVFIRDIDGIYYFVKNHEKEIQKTT